MIVVLQHDCVLGGVGGVLKEWSQGRESGWRRQQNILQDYGSGSQEQLGKVSTANFQPFVVSKVLSVILSHGSNKQSLSLPLHSWKDWDTKGFDWLIPVCPSDWKLVWFWVLPFPILVTSNTFDELLFYYFIFISLLALSLRKYRGILKHFENECYERKKKKNLSFL